MMPCRVLLIYPPLQFAKGAVPKPDGSLGIAYIAGALRDAGHHVYVLDAAVGWNGEAFNKHEELPSGLVRVGMSDDEMLAAAEAFDAYGVASTFTSQHKRAMAVVGLLRATHPHKLIMVGGVNARYFHKQFIAAGADVVFLSEAERGVVDVVSRYERRDNYTTPGVAWADGHTPSPEPTKDLDDLPMPAWDLMPNEAYWSIARPHGGSFGKRTKYAEMMTSRGCPFSCSFCHISVEHDGNAGDIAQLRLKSAARVAAELDVLQSLGVDHIYVEDDSLLAKKHRTMGLFSTIMRRGLRLADVNGVNIAHLFTNEHGKLVPDIELIEAMAACGFEDISLPFESASERVLATYCSRKWSPSRMDTAALIRACVSASLPVSGNYMMGFPDETEDEIHMTLDLARLHMSAGLGEANIFVVVPFPGTVLFEKAMRGGYLPRWDPDDMLWFKPVMKNTIVPPDVLAKIRHKAWEELNKPEYVATRKEASL